MKFKVYIGIIVAVTFLVAFASLSCLPNYPPTNPKIGQIWEYSGEIIKIEREDISSSIYPLITVFTKDAELQVLPSASTAKRFKDIIIGKTYKIIFEWTAVPVLYNGVEVSKHTGWNIISMEVK